MLRHLRSASIATGGDWPWVEWVGVPLLLAAVLLVQTDLFQRTTCETFDEFTFLRLGIDVYRRADVHGFASPMDPALPVWLEYTWPALTARHFPDTPGWEFEVPKLVLRARRQTALVVGVPLVWLVYGWLTCRRGWRAGAVGGILVALSPTIVAASAIATTDACAALFALLALLALDLHVKQPGRRSLARLGVALGLGLAAKQSAVFLVLVAAIELAYEAGRHPGGGTRVDQGLRIVGRVAGQLLFVGAIGFVVDWATFAFGSGPPVRSGRGYLSTTITLMVTMVTNQLPEAWGDALAGTIGGWGVPLPIETFFGLVQKARVGHPSYLMGHYAQRGFWLFFPVAIALKSTPVELGLLVAVFILACRRTTWRDSTRRIWLLALFSLLGMALTSTLNYGHRHVMLLYPLVVLLAVDSASTTTITRPWRKRGVALILLAGQLVSAVGVAPHYLSYFNFLAGGPYEGYRYLVDSSLDWGQDLPALRAAIEARGGGSVALAYFGTASPRAYGLQARSWELVSDPEAEGCRWLAVSATALVGVYRRSGVFLNEFARLPAIRVTPSLFLYDARDPRVRQAWAVARQGGLTLKANPSWLTIF
ncbi:MAG: glycosyltransferase family 39 protein [Isosphaeraceae bacterium]